MFFGINKSTASNTTDIMIRAFLREYATIKTFSIDSPSQYPLDSRKLIIPQEDSGKLEVQPYSAGGRELKLMIETDKEKAGGMQ
jgi:hypothetical protein